MQNKFLLILLGFIIGGIWGIFVASYTLINMAAVTQSPTVTTPDTTPTNGDTTENDSNKQLQNNNKPSNGDPLAGEVDYIAGLFELGLYEDKTDIYEIIARYPVFNISMVDESIDAFVQDTVTQFKKHATETPPDFDISDYYLEINFQTSHYNDDIVTVHFYVAEYAGGAHPSNYQVAKTFNLKTGKELELTDVFEAGAELGTMLESMIEEKLIQNMGEFADSEWIEDGVTQQVLFYEDIWIVGPEGITFVFNPYEVAAYAAGPQDVFFTWDEIAPLLNKNFRQ